MRQKLKQLLKFRFSPQRHDEAGMTFQAALLTSLSCLAAIHLYTNGLNRLVIFNL